MFSTFLREGTVLTGTAPGAGAGAGAGGGGAAAGLLGPTPISTRVKYIKIL